ncbi:hypothetical protein [Plantactinospora sp. BC1]|nr:hypothetical protein [Plantactinospora sp. BC1]
MADIVSSRRLEEDFDSVRDSRDGAQPGAASTGDVEDRVVGQPK